MLRRIKKLWRVLKYFFTDEENLLLYLLEDKAEESMEACYKLDVRSTEELEDLIFHIRAYRSIPQVLEELKYPNFRGVSYRGIIKKYKIGEVDLDEVEKYADYLEDLETQRAVERDIIFDLAKTLPFGFKYNL